MTPISFEIGAVLYKEVTKKELIHSQKPGFQGTAGPEERIFMSYLLNMIRYEKDSRQTRLCAL